MSISSSDCEMDDASEPDSTASTTASNNSASVAATGSAMATAATGSAMATITAASASAAAAPTHHTASSSDAALKPVVANPYKKTAPSEPPKFSEQTLAKMQRWLDFSANASAAAKSDEEDDLPPPPPPTADEMIANVMKSLRSKTLRDGYASYLMEQVSFQMWILIAKEDSQLWPWFQSFLDDTLDPLNSRIFDEACRLIMDELLKFGESALLKRTSTSADSFEFKLFHFLLSDELREICRLKLPTEAMASIYAGWTVPASLDQSFGIG